MRCEVLILAERAVTAGREGPAAVGISGGRIVAVEPDVRRCRPLGRGRPSASPTTRSCCPGLVDTHVHVNEPGRTEWEGFASATRAAAAGGVTTIVDMPLNSIPPTTTVDGPARPSRRPPTGRPSSTSGSGVAPSPATSPTCAPLHEAGVFGFKCFLLHSGVEEFPPLDAAGLEAAMAEIARFDAPADRPRRGRPRRSTTPRAAGPTVRRLPGLPAAGGGGARHRPRRSTPPARPAPARTSCTSRRADALPLIARGPRRRGPPHASRPARTTSRFAAEEIPDGATRVQVLPADPRGRQPRPALGRRWPTATSTSWSPTTRPAPPSSRGSTAATSARRWGGIASLQLGLPAVWTEARRRGHTLADVVRWMATAPARSGRAGRPGPDRASAPRPTSSSSPRTRSSSSTRRACSTGTRSSPTPDVRSPAPSGSTWLRGGPSTSTRTPRGRLLRRGAVMTPATTRRRAACRRRPS